MTMKFNNVRPIIDSNWGIVKKESYKHEIYYRPETSISDASNLCTAMGGD